MDLETPVASKKHVPLKRKKSILDSIWLLFASVRVAIVIIILIAVSSIIGTLIPQENSIPSNDPASYYATKYGAWGRVFYRFGFTKMYVSWWFLTLLLLLATSLIICSWERIVPLYKSLKNQVVRKSIRWIQQRRIYASFPPSEEGHLDPSMVRNSIDSSYEKLKVGLAKKGYNLKEDQDTFLAEKGRFARFGPYIIHIGLLIIIAGAFSRVIPGWYFNSDVLIQEGETKAIPYTDFSVRNNKFTIQYYNDGRPSMYQTKATIVKDNHDIKNASIEVNHALQYEQVTLFQESYGQPVYKTATITMSKPNSDKPIGSFQMNFDHPLPQYKVGDYTIQVLQYFPDFKVESNQPATDSSIAYKPTFMFEVSGPGIATPKPQAFFAFFPILSKLQKGNPVDFMIENITKTQATVLRAHKDLGIPIVYFGTGVVMFGLVLTFYFQHRRVWVRKGEDALHMGAHTNKNWYGLRKELESVLAIQSITPKGNGEGGSLIVSGK